MSLFSESLGFLFVLKFGSELKRLKGDGLWLLFSSANPRLGSFLGEPNCDKLKNAQNSCISLSTSISSKHLYPLVSISSVFAWNKISILANSRNVFWGRHLSQWHRPRFELPSNPISFSFRIFRFATHRQWKRLTLRSDYCFWRLASASSPLVRTNADFWRSNSTSSPPSRPIKNQLIFWEMALITDFCFSSQFSIYTQTVDQIILDLFDLLSKWFRWA